MINKRNTKRRQALKYAGTGALILATLGSLGYLSRNNNVRIENLPRTDVDLIELHDYRIPVHAEDGGFYIDDDDMQSYGRASFPDEYSSFDQFDTGYEDVTY